MKFFKSTAILALTAMLTSGCVQIGRTGRVNPARIAARGIEKQCQNLSGVGGDFKFALNLDCFSFQKSVSNYSLPKIYTGDYKDSINESEYTAYSLAKGDKFYRNRLQDVLLSQADANCEKEKGHIFVNEAGIGLSLDSLASGFATAATIVTGEQAKSILSGLAGLSTATRSHITANIYKNQIVPAITNMIDGERAKILTELKTKAASLTILDYSADDMIRQVNIYHQACSFQLGVQLLVKASQNKAGTDAIIHSINLNHAISSLRAARSSMTKASDQEEIDAKIKELAIELATTAQAVKGNANTDIEASTQ